MKLRSILGLILTFSFFSCHQVENTEINNTEDYKAVKVLVQNIFDDIWGEQKADLILKYHTNDFVLLEHGEVWNNETITNWCKRAKANSQGQKRINSFDFFKASKEGNRIWMAYHNYATLKYQDSTERKFEWLESVVAVKQDTVWKLELMHSTRVNKVEN